MLFAAALAVGGLVALTLVFAGEATYAEIARASGREQVTFRAIGPSTVSAQLDDLLLLHSEWVDYLTGRRPQAPSREDVVFTQAEYAHMADVRNVFIAAQIAAAVAAVAALWLAGRAWGRRTVARLVRAGTLAALVLVAAAAAAAALSFEAAFLLFHQIFFPQGNFLFEPGSNLLALYPQDYFYGVTLRIGAAFVAGALLLAAAAHASLRRAGASA